MEILAQICFFSQERWFNMFKLHHHQRLHPMTYLASNEADQIPNQKMQFRNVSYIKQRLYEGIEVFLSIFNYNLPSIMSSALAYGG